MTLPPTTADLPYLLVHVFRADRARFRDNVSALSSTQTFLYFWSKASGSPHQELGSPPRSDITIIRKRVVIVNRFDRETCNYDKAQSAVSHAQPAE